VAGSQDLEVFVRDALSRGVPRERVAVTLADAGWSTAQVQRALGSWAEVDFPVPVPRPRASLSAREAFFYLLMFAALYMAAFHLCDLMFDVLDRLLPDAADPERSWATRDIRWSTASVLITFPLFLWMARVVARQVTSDPLARLSPVRRWLTYLTLFLAALAIVIDLITLLNNVLGGDLTLRFVAKVLLVGMVAGGIFSYYLLDLRRGESA
jgi:hypothetical protein